jgi:4-hydroxybenzoate polyprenyltransferase
VKHYLAYTRPLSIPVTLVMALTGWLASPARGGVSDIIFLIVVHSFLLWGGTNAFNSAEDRDDGPVNLLPNPPPLPPHLARFGIALMLLAIAAASLRNMQCVLLVACAVVLSIFYSWRGAPWPRGKDIPGVDNLINAAGCGLGSFCLGWCATDAPLTRSALYLGLAWTVCLFGGMPTAQIFQLRRDGRMVTNWTSWLGASRTLRVGAALFAIHFVLIARVSTLGVGTILWGAGVLGAIVHSAWWSRDPFAQPHRRMVRQMTLLTSAQLAWAISS